MTREEDRAAGERDPGRAAPAPMVKTSSAPGEPTEENGWKERPLAPPTTVVSGNKLPFPIGVGTNDAEGDVATLAVSAHLTNKQFDVIETDITNAESAPDAIGKAARPSRNCSCPRASGWCRSRSRTSARPWTWVSWLNKVELFTPQTRSHYPVFGVYGTLKTPAGADCLLPLQGPDPPDPVPCPRGEQDGQRHVLLYPPAEEGKATEIQVDGRSNGLPAEK